VLKYAVGNDKLGNRCFVISRQVGVPCPSSCHFLGNGCYAEATEKRFPNARSATAENSQLGIADTVEKARLGIADWQKLRALILLAKSEGCSIRIHERGDFGRDDALDLPYVKAWARACESIVDSGEVLPCIWVYTHFLDSRIPDLLGAHVSCYASVHNLKELRQAKAAGFTMFAWIDTAHKIAGKKRRGASEGNPDAPRFVEYGRERFLVCPEQRKGRSVVTCTGKGETTACHYCTRGAGNVVFLDH
jgi:hypothetical protein